MLYGVNAALSIVDLDQFAANIEATMQGMAGLNAVGYAYSLSSGKSGATDYQVVSGADGRARIEADGEMKFTTETRMEVASVSKPITAAAFLKLIQDQALPDIDPDLDPAKFDEALTAKVNEFLDEKIIDFLPATWRENAGVGIGIVDFRNLLQHKSGFESYYLTYAELEDLVISGLENPIGHFLESYEYTTTNYSFLRELLPFVWEAVDNDILNGDRPTSDLPANMREALEADWGTIDVGSDELSASLYKLYVQTEVLGPAGLEADTKASEDNPALVYDYFGDDPGQNTEDQTLKAGGRGWNLSAVDLQAFLVNLRDNEGILRAPIRDLMIADELGFRLGAFEFGLFYGHNGANMEGDGDNLDDLNEAWSLWNEDDNIPTSINEHRVNTRVSNFPNDVLAALVVNSQIGGAPWAAANIVATDVNGDGEIDDSPGAGEVAITNGNWKADILTNAYESALIGFVVEGNSKSNAFILRYNADDDSILEVLLDDDGMDEEEIKLSWPADKLVSLRLIGHGGDDTFDIRVLPENVDLAIIGGAGDDVMKFGGDGNFGFDILGNIFVGAGEDYDRLIIDDAQGTAEVYTLAENSFASSTHNTTFLFNGIEDLSFTANVLDNSIIVMGTGTSMNVEIYAELGDDEVTLGGIGLLSNVVVHTDFGDNTVTLTDAGDFSTITVHAPTDNLPGGDNTYVLGAGDLSLIRGSVAIHGGSGSETFRLNDVDAGAARQFRFVHSSDGERITMPSSTFGGVDHDFVELVIVEAGNHNDRFDVQSLGGQVGPTGRILNVDLMLWGGLGNDEFLIAQPSKQVSNIQGLVTLHGDAATPGIPNQTPPILGRDTLVIHDQNHSQNDQFVVSANGFQGLIEKPKFALAYSGMEDIRLLAGSANNVIDVEGTPLASGPLRIFGHNGVNTVRVGLVARDQAILGSELHFNGGSQLDYLQVFDTNSPYTGVHTITRTQLRRMGAANITYSGLETVDWLLNEQNNTVNVASTSPNTLVTVHGNGGNDTLTARSLSSELVFRGGEGQDHATYMGSARGDAFVLQGNQIQLDMGLLTTYDVEGRRVHGLAGLNHVAIQGTAGTDEFFHVQPAMPNHSGTFAIGPYGSVEYVKIQSVEVFGNVGDADTLRFDGASNPSGNQNVADVFSVQMGASGSAHDPVVVLGNAAGAIRMTLLNYHNIEILEIDGKSGNDVFRVNVTPGGNVVGRVVSLQGGLAGNDLLRVSYEAASNFVWNDYGDKSGDMSFLYDEDKVDQFFQLLYNEMETVNALEF